MLVAASLAPACASKPTMKIHHAEIQGVRVMLPPSINVMMTLFVEVYNPNSYDVAIRAVRGQVVLAGRHAMAVEYAAPNADGVWLAANRTTSVAIPLAIPAPIGLAVLAESLAAPDITYHFTGRADVTASRTFRLEKDDYSVDESGTFARQQLEIAIRGGF